MLAWAENQNGTNLHYSKLSRYIKLMTFFSVLPVVSKTEADFTAKIFKVTFEVKKWRAFLVVLTDFIILSYKYFCHTIFQLAI